MLQWNVVMASTDKCILLFYVLFKFKAIIYAKFIRPLNGDGGKSLKLTYTRERGHVKRIRKRLREKGGYQLT